MRICSIGSLLNPFLGRNQTRSSQITNPLTSEPRLSLCISNYNRARWLDINLKNWVRLYPQPLEGVEVVVCDNASTDNTPAIVRRFLKRPDFRYIRNIQNVGMLGNLRETVNAARGAYVWIIGDDDLIAPNSLQRILSAIDLNPRSPLIYLNYAYTRIEDTRLIRKFDEFFKQAEPIVPSEQDKVGILRDICARNENFFTAIYTLVFRRDHAIGAYTQDTSGRPFSTMLTCIPTTYYVLNNLMDTKCVWLGEPLIVINLNVSWMRYAPLWILERIPEVYDVAQAHGVAADDMDRWRRHTLPGFVHYFKEIYRNDPVGNAEFFSAARAIGRYDTLAAFAEYRQELRDAYQAAQREGHPAAQLPIEQIFMPLPPSTPTV